MWQVLKHTMKTHGLLVQTNNKFLLQYIGLLVYGMHTIYALHHWFVIVVGFFISAINQKTMGSQYVVPQDLSLLVYVKQVTLMMTC